MLEWLVSEEVVVQGTPFGRYRLIELLGQGGMGEVWRAHDTEIDRIVAIKLLLPHFAQDEKFEQRFRREARAAARLDDPHVVPIYDVGEIDGRLFVSMRLIAGVDLQTLLQAGPLEPQRAVAIVEQIAKALHAAHTVGLVHRDIKPSNILVAKDDFAYLIDFGIARAAGETGLTSTGATIGTWSYMAPERFSTGQAEPSSDIYALACVLYECLTGQLPFPAVALEQIVAAHMTTPPPQPSTQRSGVPVAMDTVIASGLAKHPAQRYATSTELAAAARDAITTPIPHYPTTGPVVSAPAPIPPGAGAVDTAAGPAGAAATPSRWRRRTVLIPAALVLVAVLVVAAIFVITYKNPNNTPDRMAISYRPQVQLPFTGLNLPYGAAVDSAGTVYVTDFHNNRVLNLVAGATRTDELSLTGLTYPTGVAVDTGGAVYITDTGHDRVLKLTPGATHPDELPFTGLHQPRGVAVDSSGTVYVTEFYGDRVFKLAAGSTRPDELPSTGHSVPHGVAVDSAGAVYVTSFLSGRVFKLTPGATHPDELPFTGLTAPTGVAVDSAGAVYVADTGNNRVLKLPAGATHPDELPFTGLSGPYGVAVDNAGAVYVTTEGNNRVLKLPVR